MIDVTPLPVAGREATGIKVQLPKTRLVIVTLGDAHVMCGALDVQLLNDKLADRGILAGRGAGVRDYDDLLDGPLEMVTTAAAEKGVVAGETTGREALQLMNQ